VIPVALCVVAACPKTIGTICSIQLLHCLEHTTFGPSIARQA
jgi:hypothetical protein